MQIFKRFRLFTTLIGLALGACLPCQAPAQVAGGGAGGITIDAEGVVHGEFGKDATGKLDKKRLEAASRRSLSADVNAAAPLRKVSLVRMEAACGPFADRQESVPAEMQFLAGLQRIDYLFVLPESKDVVIAGPAEGFAADEGGRMLGVSTGRPPLRLDDLIVALRTVAKGGSLGCSIDPKPANLARLNDYLRQNSPASNIADAQARYDEMANILGMQDIRVWGVPGDSHYSKVLVEADYRMKLIALGLERPPVKALQSNLAMTTVGGNTAHRWWFTPLYEAFVRSPDGLAYGLAGQRTQLVAQDEIVNEAGERSDAPVTRISTTKFAQQFTEKFPELASVSPIFAELQSLVDLAVVAALLKKEQLPEQAGWKMGLFLDEQRATVAKWNVPRHIHSVANHKTVLRSRVIGLVSGGVSIDPENVLSRINYADDADGKLNEARRSARSQHNDSAHSWWWD